VNVETQEGRFGIDSKYIPNLEVLSKVPLVTDCQWLKKQYQRGRCHTTARAESRMRYEKLMDDYFPDWSLGTSLSFRRFGTVCARDRVEIPEIMNYKNVIIALSWLQTEMVFKRLMSEKVGL
jgi:hypothetical protein